MRSHPLVAVLWILSAAPAFAQMVELPAFTLGTPPANYVIRDVDATVGTDGTLMFAWDHVAQFTGIAVGMFTRPFTASGTPLRAEHLLFEHAANFRSPRIAAVPAGAIVSSSPGIDPRFPGGYFAAWFYLGNGAFIPATGLDFDGVGRGTHGFQADQEPGREKGREVALRGTAHSMAIIWWDEQDRVTHDGIVRMRVHGPSVPTGNLVDLGAGRGGPYLDLAVLPDDGVVFVWGSPSGGALRGAVQVFEAGSIARGPAFAPSDVSVARRVATNPAGDVIAVVGTRPEGSAAPNELWARRFDLDGNPLGPEFLVHAAAPGTALDADAEFDGLGNLYVLWSDGSALRARAFDGDDVAAGPAVTLATGVGRSVDVERLPSGNLLNAWVLAAPTATAHANIVTSCVTGTSVCGDGTRQPFCEACDDGAGNDDTLPDACRSDCRPARCGDGVIDSGETCDDGNVVDCDGCNATCEPEIGNVCGDGIALMSCGEQCDDGNTIAGDGCSLACALERVPGGGTAKSDCYTEWSVDNPANEPRFDKHGAFSARHVCVDDDPRCDFDGGTPGGCVMHVRVCVNNTDIAACAPPSRLLRWELKTPSANKAARDPASAAVRAALLGVVPSTVVGPEGRDLCSPPAEVPVVLRGNAGAHRGVVKLKTRAFPYTPGFDVDGLTLTCLPAAP